MSRFKMRKAYTVDGKFDEKTVFEYQGDLVRRT